MKPTTRVTLAALLLCGLAACRAPDEQASPSCYLVIVEGSPSSKALRYAGGLPLRSPCAEPDCTTHREGLGVLPLREKLPLTGYAVYETQDEWGKPALGLSAPDEAHKEDLATWPRNRVTEQMAIVLDDHVHWIGTLNDYLPGVLTVGGHYTWSEVEELLSGYGDRLR